MIGEEEKEETNEREGEIDFFPKIFLPQSIEQNQSQNNSSILEIDLY